MVIKSKGVNKARSVYAGKAKKRQQKHHSKYNYKKKPNPATIECTICYEQTHDHKDNSVMCGTIKQIVCGSCKIRMKDKLCPMCRSHDISMPINQYIEMNVNWRCHRYDAIYAFRG